MSSKTDELMQQLNSNIKQVVPLNKDVKRYKYATGKKTTAAWSVDLEYIDKIDRIAYHERKSRSEVVNEILEKALKGLDLEDIPVKHKTPAARAR